jgi:hypothetical protein
LNERLEAGVSTSASVWVLTVAHSYQIAGVDQIHILVQGRLQEKGAKAFIGRKALEALVQLNGNGFPF